MKYLLDTHILIWHLEADLQLPLSLSALIDDPAHEVFISAASLWEMTIKVSLGKLTLAQPLASIFQHVQQVGFETLPIQPQHLLVLAQLPLHHRDPFDRLLIAQSITEPMPLISADQMLDAYGVSRLWSEPSSS